MRNAAAWLTSLVLLAGALSAVVATATVKWLYPQAARVAAPTIPAPATPVAAPAAASKGGPLEELALDLIRRAGSGDLSGALALTVPGAVTADMLKSQVARLRPTPLRAALLPGPEGKPAQLLVWADYRREDGKAGRGLYQVTIAGNKVAAVQGPVAPEGGYRSLPLQPLDERAGKVDMNTYRGHALLLWSPRTPEPGLAEAMSALQAAYAPKGIDVVLVLDIRSPDWLATARNAGFQGPVWRIKGRLEDVPVPSRGTYLGAAGVLVSRDGLAVAALAALDPSRYGLLDQPVQAIAPTVFQAYGLLP